MDTFDMGTSNFDTGDNEPSMEDILASIRQIIADDGVNGVSNELDITAEDDISEEPAINEAETIQDEGDPSSVEILNDSHASQEDNSDILELMNFMDESAQDGDDQGMPPSTDSNLLENTIPEGLDGVVDKVKNIPTPAVGFDESLDLVMDADASDYVTTNVRADTPRFDVSRSSLEDELFTDIEKQNGNAEDSLVIPDIPDDAKAGVEPKNNVNTTTKIAAVAAGQVQTGHDEDMDLVKSLLSDLMDDSVGEDDVNTSEEDGVDLHSDFEEALSSEDKVVDAKESLEAEVDVDFVTGEAMDANALDAIFDDDTPPVIKEAVLEPKADDTPVVAEVVGGNKENIAQERDFVTGEMIDSVDEAAIFGDETDGDTATVLDEVLQKSVEDEVALHNELTGTSVPTIEPEVIENTDTYTLTNKIEEKIDVEPEVEPVSSELAIEDVARDDDVVALPEIDANSKLSLLKKTAAGASVLGLGAVALMTNEDAGATQDEELGDGTAMQEQTETPPQNNQTEKESTMAQAAQKETLLDTETATGSASAFASLNSAVQEKTKKDESGPAIGDLVHEALKPMLKEWLDKNLKGIVERAVTKEVKRISSGK